MNIHTVALGDVVQASTAIVAGAAGGGASANPVAADATEAVATTEGTSYTLYLNLELDKPGVLPGGATKLQIAVPLALELIEAPIEDTVIEIFNETDDDDE